jgi:hypothetical protein
MVKKSSPTGGPIEADFKRQSATDGGAREDHHRVFTPRPGERETSPSAAEM